MTVGTYPPIGLAVADLQLPRCGLAAASLISQPSRPVPEVQSGRRWAMAQLSRTGVSLEDDLLKEFDRLIAKRGYANRSEAFRDLIREALLSESVESNKPVVGTLTLVYDHHVPNLAQKLTEVQHRAGTMVLPGSDHHEGPGQGDPGGCGRHAGPAWGRTRKTCAHYLRQQLEARCPLAPALACFSKSCYGVKDDVPACIASFCAIRIRSRLLLDGLEIAWLTQFPRVRPQGIR